MLVIMKLELYNKREHVQSRIRIYNMYNHVIAFNKMFINLFDSERLSIHELRETVCRKVDEKKN